MSKVHKISISKNKGERKTNVPSAKIIENFGIENDAHTGLWHRQVSLLALESVEKMAKMGLDVKSGDFAENITTVGLDLLKLPIGAKLQIGDGCVLLITQLGKVCHHRCAIYHLAGDCVMPKEGIFAKVLKGSEIKEGDKIEPIKKDGYSVGIITLSDKGSRKEREDLTGVALVEFISNKINTSFVRLEVIPDDKPRLEMMLKDFCDTQKFDIVITNGSTGLSERDIAPDVTLPLIEKRLQGFEEIMRIKSYEIKPAAIISRAVAGTRGGSLIINLPGSPKGAVENLGFVIDAIPHAVDKLQGDMSDCAKP